MFLLKGIVVLGFFVCSAFTTIVCRSSSTTSPLSSTTSVSTGCTVRSLTTMSGESHIVVPTIRPSPTCPTILKLPLSPSLRWRKTLM